MTSCHWPGVVDPAEISIQFTRLPPAGNGNPDKLEAIEGRVTGALPGQRIVLFARSGVWWVQPFADRPFTEVGPDGAWKSLTHPGAAYGALLVTPEYRPPSTISALPEKGGAIAATLIAAGTEAKQADAETIEFSGYQWELRKNASERGGTRNQFDPANVRTDDRGFLHLRIAKTSGGWTSSEVSLPRSLGYGSYRFVVGDVSELEPATVLSLYTWDDAGPREVDIEISRWGESNIKNAQYVIQPYYVPANVIRFAAPKGTLTHSFTWEPGRMAFSTGNGSRTVAEHVFTSGVPSPGGESIHVAFYVYDNPSNPLRRGSEAVIEKFEYLP